MNRRQKEILEAQLKSEKGVLNQLRKEYRDALAQINEEIKTFQADIQSKQDALSMVTDQTQRQRLQSEIQSKIYQRDYQKALKGQVSAILDTMNSNQYDRIKDYIEGCYEAGYTGTMYDLQGQGLPIIAPIDQTQVVKAVTNDTKLSVPLYTALGYQVGVLKKAVTSEISRGIATAMSWSDIARNIQKRTNVTMNKAYRIARTEGHRVQNQAAYDAQHKAKAAGADIVKQWCATLDSRTRAHHAQLDGQLRELDETFEVDGHKALHPGGFGVAAEDINCRCRLLQRARWALDDDELNTLKERAEYFGLDKTKDFEEFQKKYTQSAKTIEKEQKSVIIKKKDYKDEVVDVHYVGKINRDIYECVTKDIVTENVIITDVQIKHIKERHPNDYERYCSYFEEIITRPDYIVEANRPNTALVLKQIEVAGEVFKTVLRLATSKDDPSYSNSIITFMKIDDKEWKRLLRNKSVLYKRE